MDIRTLVVVLGLSGVVWAEGATGGDFAPGKPMKVARMGHLTARLSDGSVVLFGGHGTGFTSLGTAEIYSPAADSFTLATMQYTHDMPAIARLADGKILLAGGSSDLGVPAYATSEIFDPSTGLFSATGNMVRFRAGAGAATLKSGNVLISGAWWTHNDASSYGEVYAAGAFSATEPNNSQRAYPLTIATDDGKAVVFGGAGITGGSAAETVELFDPSTGSFTVLAPHPFDDADGWYVGASLNHQHPLEEQRLKDGSYLLMASKSATDPALYTFDPATKQFTRLSVNPPLPQGVSLYEPVVDTARNAAYLLMLPAQNDDSVRLQLSVVNLTTLTRTSPTGTYTVPQAPLYCGGLALALLGDGRIVVAGFNTQPGYNTNFSPSNYTAVITPNVDITGVQRSSKCDASHPSIGLAGRILRVNSSLTRGNLVLYDLAGHRVAVIPGKLSGSASSFAVGRDRAPGHYVAVINYPDLTLTRSIVLP